MSKTISGQIERVQEFKGAYGPMVSLVVAGEKYGAGKTSQGAKEGDWVTFTTTQNPKGYWDIDKGSLKPIDAPKGASSPVPAVAASAARVADARQDSIIRQSSRKDALHFVDIAVGAGLVDFGKSKGADRLAILETYVDKFTDHFVEEVTKGSTWSSQDAPTTLDVDDSFDDEKIPF